MSEEKQAGGIAGARHRMLRVLDEASVRISDEFKEVGETNVGLSVEGDLLDLCVKWSIAYRNIMTTPVSQKVRPPNVRR